MRGSPLQCAPGGPCEQRGEGQLGEAGHRQRLDVGNFGAADIVSNQASMHRIAAVAAATGLVARCLLESRRETVSRQSASRTSSHTQAEAKLRLPACPCNCSISTPIHGTSSTPHTAKSLASRRDR